MARLVYLSESVLPSRTANAVHVMKMCRAFARLGHEVILLAPHAARESEAHDPFAYYGMEPLFEIHRLPWPFFKGRAYYYALCAARCALALQPRLVYGRFLPACWLAARLGLPTVYESHALVFQSGRLSAWFFARLVRLPAFRRLVVISNALKDDYAAHDPSLLPLIQVAPDAADPVAPMAARPFSHPGRLQVGYLGHLYPGRGVERILELARLCSWADFHLVGGTDVDASRWRETARALPNFVVHGYIPPPLTDGYRLACDVLLAPYQKKVSVHGGGDTSRWMSPLKLFEYMAAGKAILCSDLPVLREVLQHEKSALLCDPERPDAWAAALLRLRDDVPLREALGRRAQQDFFDRFTWEKRAEQVLEGLL